MQHWVYLVVLAGCAALAVPLELVFGLRVLRRPALLLTALIPGLVIFGAWDVYAVHQQQWSYDPRHIVGLMLPAGIPIEEALFFLVIPVCAVLTFEAVERCRRPAPAVEPTASMSEPAR